MIKTPGFDSKTHANMVYDKGDISKQMRGSNNRDVTHRVRVIFLIH